MVICTFAHHVQFVYQIKSQCGSTNIQGTGPSSPKSDLHRVYGDGRKEIQRRFSAGAAARFNCTAKRENKSNFMADKISL